MHQRRSFNPDENGRKHGGHTRACSERSIDAATSMRRPLLEDRGVDGTERPKHSPINYSNNNSSSSSSSSSSNPSSLVLLIVGGITMGVVCLITLVDKLGTLHWMLLLAMCLFVVVALKYLNYQTRQHKKQQATQLEHHPSHQRRHQQKQQELQEKELVSQSSVIRLDMTEHHLEAFLESHPTATYEEWIADLHPEYATTHRNRGNVHIHVDQQFYTHDSDHRHLWNQRIHDNTDDEKYVPPRQVQ